MQRDALALLRLGKEGARSLGYLSMSQMGFHVQEKQKNPSLSAWVTTTIFGEASLWLESPVLTHRSNTKASRTASTILNSYSTGTAFRQEAGATTGVPARQRQSLLFHLQLLPCLQGLFLSFLWDYLEVCLCRANSISVIKPQPHSISVISICRSEVSANKR